MCVDEIDVPRAHSRTDAPCGAHVPVGGHGNRRDCESRSSRFLDQRRARGADEELFMSLFAKTERKQKNLALAAAPGRA